MKAGRENTSLETAKWDSPFESFPQSKVNKTVAYVTWVENGDCFQLSFEKEIVYSLLKDKPDQLTFEFYIVQDGSFLDEVNLVYLWVYYFTVFTFQYNLHTNYYWETVL